MVPQQYHEYLDVLEEEEKTELPPHRPGVDLDIKLEEGQGLPVKKIYALSQDELEQLWNYIKQNDKRGWIRETYSDGDLLSCSKKGRKALTLRRLSGT